jgi:hypothetical protein
MLEEGENRREKERTEMKTRGRRRKDGWAL